MRNLIKKIICLLQSIPFNLKYLPLAQAIKIPIVVGGRLECIGLRKGTLLIESPVIKLGMIKIGVGQGPFHLGEGKTFIKTEKNARIIFHGSCDILRGAKISATNQGVIEFGHLTLVSANCIVSSNSLIKIDDFSRLGWNVTLMDWDGHDILDIESRKVTNTPRPILIGRCCWLGAHCNIMKGVSLNHHIIIPSRSVITKSCETPFAIFGSAPNRILKTDVVRGEFLDK